LEEAYRFNPDDVLVFRVLLKNKTAQPSTYRPDSLRVSDPSGRFHHKTHHRERKHSLRAATKTLSRYETRNYHHGLFSQGAVP